MKLFGSGVPHAGMAAEAKKRLFPHIDFLCAGSGLRGGAGFDCFIVRESIRLLESGIFRPVPTRPAVPTDVEGFFDLFLAFQTSPHSNEPRRGEKDVHLHVIATVMRVG
jgi:hypothetical protein